MRKRNDPKAEPCEISLKISLLLEISFAITTNYFLSFRYNMNQSFATPQTP